MNKFLGLVKKNASKILLATTLVSYGASLYFTAKSALAVNEIVDTPTTKKEDRKRIIKACTPSAITTALTISCIIFTYIHNKKQEALLTGMLISSQQLFNKYRQNVRIDASEEEDISLMSDSVAELKKSDEFESPRELEPGEVLYCESITGEFFVMNEKDFINAEMTINKLMHLQDEVTFNEWLELLHLPKTDEGDKYGWSVYSDEFYGYKNIDVKTKEMKAKDGTTYQLIVYICMPHCDYECPDGPWIDLVDEYGECGTFMNSKV